MRWLMPIYLSSCTLVDDKLPWIGEETDTTVVDTCTLPVPEDTGCGGDDPDIRPDAAEVCDGIDNDCDGLIDDDDPSADESSMTTWYTDRDDDGYGTDDSATAACEEPYASSVLLGGDCDDDNADVNPGEPEVCEDGADQDCDGQDATCAGLE